MINIIAAVDNKNGIAKHGVQPWDIPSDMRYFTEMTKSKGATVLMGHTTFRVIGRRLPERQNLVLSRRLVQAPGVEVIADLREVIARFKNQDNLWVIGGEAVYQQTIKYADRLYLTKIDADFGCDQFFPEYASRFYLVSKGGVQTENGFSFSFNLYQKNKD